MNDDWTRIAHPFGTCVAAHVGIGPELVKVGKVMTTHCLCCMTREAVLQKLKDAQRAFLCATCKEAIAEQAKKDAELKALPHVCIFDGCYYEGNVTGVPDTIYYCKCGRTSR